MSPLTEVYRIEHRTDRSQCGPVGAGPWAGGRDIGFELKASDMPTPYGDGFYDEDDKFIAFPTRSYVCGFAAMEKLHFWFRHDYARLARANFVVRTYRVPAAAVRYGKQQVTFDSELAVQVQHTRAFESDPAVPEQSPTFPMDAVRRTVRRPASTSKRGLR